MTWRIVEISSNCKLEYKLNYLVVRNVDGIKKVFLPEIAVLIIESTAISLTSALISELMKRKIKVIFCDEKHNPESEILPYYGSHDSVKKLRNQISWSEITAEKIWARIVSDKISKQMGVLVRKNHFSRAKMLKSYIGEIKPYDCTNREGHAAKVYFNTLFGDKFARGNTDEINSALDYGYAILLSAFNREISICGYSTQLGIFHDNMFNEFNLSSDLMEPFRPIVDECVINMDLKEFGTEQKRMLVNLLNSVVMIGGKQNYLINAIRLYVQSFFDAIENNDEERLMFYEVEVHEGDGVF